jgi:hypothetical protein
LAGEEQEVEMAVALKVTAVAAETDRDWVEE